MPRTPFAYFASIEYRVTLASTETPWATVVVERFTGSKAERDAYRLAASLDGLGGAIVGVCCSQCV